MQDSSEQDAKMEEPPNEEEDANELFA